MIGKSVVTIGSQKSHQFLTFALREARAHADVLQLALVVVGDPISTTGLNPRDADALTQRLYDSISTTYAEYRE